MKNEKTRSVGAPLRKRDAISLLSGAPVFLDDLPEPEGCLTVKLLRSPHAHAMIQTVSVARALEIPGVVAVYTFLDVPTERFTEAGQEYPETSPHDRLILDRHLRHIGDPVAIVAAETPDAAERALSAIDVSYEILPAVLDLHTAKDNPSVLHPEEDTHSLFDFSGYDPKRNLCASGEESEGDVDGVMGDCPVVFEHTYHVKALNQVPAETFRTLATFGEDGRLHILSSTQIVFHVQRIVAHALGIPKAQVAVEKVRIGGGFGSKQTAVSEVYPAFVTYKTHRPSKIVYTRTEFMEAGSPRHEMEITVKIGASRDGKLRAVDMFSLSNTGAYGEHGWTTVGLSAHKSIPLYTPTVEAFRFRYEVVYTNRQSSGAYRGFGATQGIFALESAVNELADRLGMDPLELRLAGCVKEGQKMPAYYGEIASSCSLETCLRRCADLFGWAEKYPVRRTPDGKIRAAGMAMAMQGSGISGIDVGSATVKLGEGGRFTLLVGAADMGTGCDTILSQMLADRLDCSASDIDVVAANTDRTPYDSGSYASSTTFVTGKAVVLAADAFRAALVKVAAQAQGVPASDLEYRDGAVYKTDGTSRMTVAEIAAYCKEKGTKLPEETASNCCPTSPPPFIVGMAEIELDPEVGKVVVLNYTAVVDCGTVVNPALARVQTEGGLLQGIGMALYEDIHYNERGKLAETNLMTYRIPTRLDVKSLNVEFAPSYEELGPYGAKSIGEVVINTPAPAVAHAIARASGKYFRTLPITPEKIVMTEGDAE